MEKSLIEDIELMPIKKLAEDKLLTIKQVAKILEVNPRTAYERWSEGHFMFVKSGGSLRVWESSVYNYLKRLTILNAYEHGVLEDTIKDFLKNDENQ